MSKTPISDAYWEVLCERDPETGKTRATQILEAMTAKADKGHKGAKALLPRLRVLVDLAEGCGTRRDAGDEKR